MVNVVIEPYEPIVADAIKLIQQKEPSYFDGIKKVVVESQDKGHFGRVESDKDDTIFISIARLRNALSGSSEEDQVFQAALTLAHEMGHLKSNFQGGEAPAESEEARMANVLRRASLDRRVLASRYARSMSKKGSAYTSPYEIAQSIIGIIGLFVSKVKDEHRQDYINNMREKILQINLSELPAKPKNPGSGLGSTKSMIKNILAGNTYENSYQAIALVLEQLESLL